MFTATAVALALLQAATPSQFDLVCTGTITTRGTYTGTSEKEWTPRYRINLTNSTWCADTCERVYPIHSISAAEIVLTEERSASSFNRTRVNRSTGELFGEVDLGSIKQQSVATCQRAAFSGMPSAAF